MSQSNQAGWRLILSGLQMLFVAFGALVLMPLITGLDTSVALFTAGIGTLIFHLVTKRSVPVFLASSFIYIAPILAISNEFGTPATMGALFSAGFVYFILAGIVAFKGPDFISRIMPAVVTGPIIIVVGLSLAPVAINMAMGKTGDASAVLFDYQSAMIVSMCSLIATIIVAVFAKGFFRLVPILAGIIVGCSVAYYMDMMTFSKVGEAAWLSVPNFTAPEFNIKAILIMLPVALVTSIEHVGDIAAISGVAKKDFTKNPGLHRTLLGDGLATSAAALFGGPPNTTYSEVTGAVVLTKSFNPMIMIIAAVFAIVLAFFAKFGVLLSSIPSPVMGGILILLFGSIAGVGINILIKERVDLENQRNLVIVGTTLVLGVGGMLIGDKTGFHLQGVSMAGVAALTLNFLLPKGSTES